MRTEGAKHRAPRCIERIACGRSCRGCSAPPVSLNFHFLSATHKLCMPSSFFDPRVEHGHIIGLLIATRNGDHLVGSERAYAQRDDRSVRQDVAVFGPLDGSAN